MRRRQTSLICADTPDSKVLQTGVRISLTLAGRVLSMEPLFETGSVGFDTGASRAEVIYGRSALQ